MGWWIQMFAADLLVVIVGVAVLFGVLWLIGKGIDMFLTGALGDGGVGDATHEVHEWNPEREQRED